MNEEDFTQKKKFVQYFFALLLIISFLGTAQSVLFHGGSPAAKYMAKVKQLEMVDEKAVEDYMNDSLFSDKREPELELELVSVKSEDERSQAVEWYFTLDKVLIVFLSLSSFAFILPSRPYGKFFQVILLAMSLYLFAQAWAIVLTGGKAFSELSILAHATRWGLPLALWSSFREKTEALSTSKGLRRILIYCCVFTFFIHGWEAYSLTPVFQDLIYNFCSLFAWPIQAPTIHSILKIVGCMDILLALSLFFIRSPKIYLWMAIWGLITALSRPLTLGLEAWPELAIRSANGGLPFILFLLSRDLRDRKISTDSPQNNMESIQNA
jgi:hypothetical protein